MRARPCVSTRPALVLHLACRARWRFERRAGSALHRRPRAASRRPGAQPGQPLRHPAAGRDAAEMGTPYRIHQLHPGHAAPGSASRRRALGGSADRMRLTLAAQCPGQCVAALILEFRASDRPVRPQPRHGRATLFPSGDVVASSVGEGAAEIWTDFRLDAEGFGRMLMINRGLTAGPRRSHGTAPAWRSRLIA